MKVLRFRCGCGRNLADATAEDGHLDVTPRLGVAQTEHRPDRYSPPTLTWRCRCGQVHQRRRDRIAATWQEHRNNPERVVVLIVGVDV